MYPGDVSPGYRTRIAFSATSLGPRHQKGMALHLKNLAIPVNDSDIPIVQKLVPITMSSQQRHSGVFLPMSKVQISATAVVSGSILSG
jgi:hypothetical protein